MKTLGLIGGMSWESTIPYYRHINQAIRQRLGGLHSAQILLYSVDFQQIEAYQRNAEWDRAGQLLAEVALRLQGAGAEALVLCTNTMHQVAPAIEAAAAIPLLHIADPTALAIRQAGFATVGLLGTRFTMEQPFYRQRLSERHGLKVLVPEQEQRHIVHRIIYEELCLGRIEDSSRSAFLEIIGQLAERGAEVIILGCTEISLLVQPQHVSLPLFDTTELHALAAADWMLA